MLSGHAGRPSSLVDGFRRHLAPHRPEAREPDPPLGYLAYKGPSAEGRCRPEPACPDNAHHVHCADMFAAETWLALLRVVVGAWFLKAVWTKLALGLAWGVLPYPTVSSRFIAFHPKRVAEFAAGNPIGWYKDFLEQTVLPNAALFATLQTWGEVAVGIGLTLGLATRLTALVGLYLAVNFGLATQWMSSGQQGFHVLLVTSMIIFIGAGAGRAWGLDALLLRRADRAGQRWLRLLG